MQRRPGGRVAQRCSGRLAEGRFARRVIRFGSYRVASGLNPCLATPGGRYSRAQWQCEPSRTVSRTTANALLQPPYRVQHRASSSRTGDNPDNFACNFGSPHRVRPHSPSSYPHVICGPVDDLWTQKTPVHSYARFSTSHPHEPHRLCTWVGLGVSRRVGVVQGVLGRVFGCRWGSGGGWVGEVRVVGWTVKVVGTILGG